MADQLTLRSDAPKVNTLNTSTGQTYVLDVDLVGEGDLASAGLYLYHRTDGQELLEGDGLEMLDASARKVRLRLPESLLLDPGTVEFHIIAVETDGTTTRYPGSGNVHLAVQGKTQRQTKGALMDAADRAEAADTSASQAASQAKAAESASAGSATTASSAASDAQAAASQAAIDKFTYAVDTVAALPASATSGETALITTGTDRGKVYSYDGAAWNFEYRMGGEDGEGFDTLPPRLHVDTIAELKALGSDRVVAGGQTVVVNDAVQGGVFVYESVLASFDGGRTIEATNLAGGFRRLTTEVVNVRDFGAVGDGSADDTAALDAAASTAWALAQSGEQPLLLFPPGNNYPYNGALQIREGIDVEMQAPIRFTETNGAVGLTVGDLSSLNRGAYLRLKVRRDSYTNTAWDDEAGDIGVKLINPTDCDIHLDAITGFTILAQFLGDDNGGAHAGSCSYSQVWVGKLTHGKYQLDLVADGGYCTELRFYNGRFANFSSHNSDLARYGVRMSAVNTQFSVNNIRFYNPCWELGDSHGTGECVIWVAENAVDNIMLDTRNEGNGPVALRAKAGATGNRMVVLRNVNAGLGVDYAGGDATNEVVTRDHLRTARFSPVFHSGAIAERCQYYDTEANGFKRVHYGGLLAAMSFRNTFSKVQYGDSVGFIREDYLETTDALAVGALLNVRQGARLLLDRDVDPARTGRAFVACFDESGNRLDNSTERFVSDVGLQFNTSYGGVWITGVDNDRQLEILITDPNVAQVCIGARGSMLRSFTVSTPRRALVNAETPTSPRRILRAADPERGVFEQGRIYEAGSPATASGGTGAYVVTQGGGLHGGAWASGTSYSDDDWVLGSDGAVYQALASNSGVDPTTGDGSIWSKRADGEGQIIPLALA